LWATDPDGSGLARVYHQSVRVTALIVAPACALLIFFPYDVLVVWTRSADVASQAALPLAVLGYAALLNSLMHVPYSLQLAAGLTRIAVWNNGLSVAVLLPLLYVLVKTYGIAGGAFGWALFNTSYFLFVPLVMHRYVLRGHWKTWIVRDTLPFVGTAVLVFGIGRFAAGFAGGGAADYAAVAAAGATYAAIVTLAFAEDLPLPRVAHLRS
jgi:O-antigen/teichoic acid export membrane protein